VLIPWTAINLVDYYLIRRGEYDVEAFFGPSGGQYGQLAGLFGRKIDLVSLRSLHPLLRTSVLAEARPVYAA
jgi:purine-cytosine permease-like protein